jgi:hypothetical protein
VVYPVHLEKQRDKVAGKTEKSWEEKEREFYASDNRYTQLFFNRLPDKTMSKVIIFSIAFISGLVMGMVKSVYMSLMEVVDNTTLSLFSIVYYPLSYKMFCAPVVDMFYIPKLGKCKSYLVSCGLILSIIFYTISGFTESMINRDGVVKLTIVWYTIFQTLVFFQCAADIYLLKISPEVTKPELSMYQDLGSVSGEFLAFNIFLPLNSVKFLNRSLFKENPLTEPVITHKQFLLFMASMTLLIVLIILLFVGERIVEHNANQVSCQKLARVIPRFFSRIEMVKLIIYIVFMRVLRYMVNATIYPKLTRLGFSKADMANVDTVLFPAFFLISLCGLKKLMVEGGLMKLNHIMNCISAFLVLSKYFLIVDLEANNVPIRTFWLLASILFIERFSVRPVYLGGFINTIAPVEIGSTFVALFMSINVACQSVPTSMGLWLEDHLPLSYATFVLVPMSAQFLILAFTAKYAVNLDSTPKEA